MKDIAGGTDNDNRQVIMVVDDADENIWVLTSCLENSGHRVRAVRDGQTALDDAKKAPPDLILLDVVMPGMDGFEVCRRLKEDPLLRDIPVIFMTALIKVRDKLKGFSLGAVDYITKPIQNEEVLARVNTHLQLRELNERLEQKVYERTEALHLTNRRLTREIAERKRVEEALRESEKRYRSIYEEARAGIAIVDYLDGRILSCNPEFENQTGRTREELSRLHIWDVRPPIQRESAREIFNRTKRCNEGCAADMCFLQPGGEKIYVDCTSSELTLHGKKILQVVVIDTTDRMLAREALLWEAGLERAVAAVSRELIAESWEIGNIAELILKCALELTGSKHGFVTSLDEAAGESLGLSRTEMFDYLFRNGGGNWILGPAGEGNAFPLPGHERNTCGAFFTNDPSNHGGCGESFKDRGPLEAFLSVPLVMGDRPTGQIALADPGREYVARDIKAVERLAELYAFALHRHRYETERKELESQLRQLQKVEAIGVLAGGIAHDFNNILFPILGYSEMLDGDLPPGSPYKEFVDEIITGTKRARDLVKQILTFSRQSEQEIGPIEPQHILKEVVRLIRATIPSTIKIVTRIDVNCPSIMADPTQIHQVCMNLVTNAFHAMQESGGKLAIRLEKPAPGEGADGFAPQVRLTVEDTGVGMEPAVAEKIFDPYFTTKSKDKGTGLGLSVVHGIVKSYGGKIHVASTPGKGTRFDLLFPAVEEEWEVERKPSSAPGMTGHERILVVDDEEQVARLIKAMLERFGYKVEIKTGSPEALAAVREAPESYDLVITDMTMPEMTGDRLATEILLLNPAMPIIICTGFSEKITREKAVAIGVKSFILKPILKFEMARQVRKALDGEEEGS